jgi:threonine/homoserine/homoserine lactone efflux protein
MHFLTLFSTALLVGFSGAIMPGPMFTLTVREVPRLGRFAGVAVSLGHSILEFLVVMGLVFGLGNWLKNSIVLGLIGLIGGLVLLWMGYGMIKFGICRNTPDSDISAPSEDMSSVKFTENPSSIRRIAVAGAVASIGNPYWVLWWATIGAGYVAFAYKYGIIGVTSFYLGHILSDFIWFTLVSIAFYAGKQVMPGSTYKWFVVACGIFLMILALGFSAAGVRYLI